MYVKLISYTPTPEKLVASAAKLCYSSCEIENLISSLNEENISSFLTMLSKMGHESPLEHISFTFAIEDVSRSLLAQLTRHRIASYSVQSQRYVKSDSAEFVIPPEIEKLPEAKKEFISIMGKCHDSYNKLTKILKDKYKASAKENNSNLEKTIEKIAIEDARYVLPNAWSTKIICTFNARSLLNFFKHRCCKRAQWEIRELACEMLKIVKEIAPNIFSNAGPTCLNGKCSEGKMTCGQMEEVRKFFKGKVGENE